MRKRVPVDVLVKFRSCEDIPDKMPMPEDVFVNAKVCVESPSRILIPVEVLVKFRFCEDTPDKIPIANADCVKAND